MIALTIGVFGSEYPRTSRSYPPPLLRDRDITIHNSIIAVSTASVCTYIVYPLRSICSCGHVFLFYVDFLSRHTRRINNFKLHLFSISQTNVPRRM